MNKETAEKAVYEFFPLSATGTALLITGILSGLALRLRPGRSAGCASEPCAGSGSRC